MKLWVIVKTSKKHKGRLEAIHQTWGQDFEEHGAKVLFSMCDPLAQEVKLEAYNSNDNNHPRETLMIPGEDSHRGLVSRMIWLVRWLKDKPFEHVVTIDDDCSVNVPLFMDLPWNECEMYGNDNGGYLAGCCTIWSKGAIEKFGPWGNEEDVCVGNMAKWYNIKQTHAGHNVIRPWREGEDGWKLEEGIAVQHYSRTPEQIRENHKTSLTLNKK